MGRGRITFTVRAVDRGWKKLRAIAKRIGEDDRTYVKVGVLGPRARAEHDGGISTVGLAIIHEFGTETIPERSFIRSTYDAHRAEYMAMLKKLVAAVVSTKPKMTEKEALGILGAKIASDMKAKITEGEGIPPPLSPETIRRKGSSRPLVDTGQLLNSITWEVHASAGGEGGGEHGGGGHGGHGGHE
jgi:hypothetical protein